MKFEHLEFTEEQAKKQNLVVMSKESIYKILEDIHEKNYKKHHRSYCYQYIYGEMKERCFIFDNKTDVLVLKDVFDRMIKIYQDENNSEYHCLFLMVEKFNPIRAMFIRNQVSEC